MEEYRNTEEELKDNINFRRKASLHVAPEAHSQCAPVEACQNDLLSNDPDIIIRGIYGLIYLLKQKQYTPSALRDETFDRLKDLLDNSENSTLLFQVFTLIIDMCNSDSSFIHAFYVRKFYINISKYFRPTNSVPISFALDIIDSMLKWSKSAFTFLVKTGYLRILSQIIEEEDLSVSDFENITSSIKLVATHNHFCVNFGNLLPYLLSVLNRVAKNEKYCNAADEAALDIWTHVIKEKILPNPSGKISPEYEKAFDDVHVSYDFQPFEVEDIYRQVHPLTYEMIACAATRALSYFDSLTALQCHTTAIFFCECSALSDEMTEFLVDHGMLEAFAHFVENSSNNVIIETVHVAINIILADSPYIDTNEYGISRIAIELISSNFLHLLIEKINDLPIKVKTEMIVFLATTVSNQPELKDIVHEHFPISSKLWNLIEAANDKRTQYGYLLWLTSEVFYAEKNNQINLIKEIIEESGNEEIFLDLVDSVFDDVSVLATEIAKKLELIE